MFSRQKKKKKKGGSKKNIQSSKTSQQSFHEAGPREREREREKGAGTLVYQHPPRKKRPLCVQLLTCPTFA